MSSEENIVVQEEKIIFYSNDEATVTIDVYFVDETFWLSQKSMSKLFDVDVRTINDHLENIYKTEELPKDSTIRNFRIVQKEGTRNVTRNVMFYNLDVTISVGYRVNSKQATQFRKWATNTLTEFITKGFVLNDRMLKNGKPFGKDYFDELLDYKTVQNKLHFATTGNTAAEIIYNRADSKQPYMGLTTWKNEPQGKVLKSDTTIAPIYSSSSSMRIEYA
jgi:hypothetical protein